MLLLDEVELTEEDGQPVSVGRYTVRGDEFFFAGALSRQSHCPGVIQCEMIAQSAVAPPAGHQGRRPHVYGLNNVKFKHPLLPRYRRHDGASHRAQRHLLLCKGKLEANGKLCTSAEFSFAIVPQRT